MKIYVLFLSILLIGSKIAEDTEEKTASKILNSEDVLKDSPTRVATQQDLQDSYNQFMSLESSPEEKAKMDQMMEKLAGIDVGSSDSTTLKDKPKPEQKEPEIKEAKPSDDDRKLVGNDSIMQMSNEMNQDNLSTEPATISDMKDDFSSEPSLNDNKGDRKLNVGMTDMSTGINTDMADMKNSFDDMNSMGRETSQLDDSMDGIDSGLHANATKAIINRMDETNQQRLSKLNAMFPPPSKLMPKKRKKKNSEVIDIKKMLKNYPPGLVDEFMPELKEKVMHKFNEMKRSEKQNRRIRKLKRKLELSRKKQRRRRKLREKRRKQMLRRRRNKRRREHQRRRRRALHHFKPHFRIKRNSKRKQFHSLKVINKFMHHRHNHLNHLHHLRERRLEDDASKNTSNSTEDPFENIEMGSTNSSNNFGQGKEMKIVLI
jgi:hypothetical protein